ncbi:MAG: FAD-dependent oxidoreductase [Actinomycetota bacterium]
MRIAVVGSGVAGLTCAHVLGRHHDVTLFEADDRLGGHANTVEVVDPQAGPLGVDTGFIVHNDRNYPNFQRLLGELGVAAQDTEMSFAVTDRSSGFSYRATNLNTLFAKRSNLVNPTMWRMLVDIVRFYRNARRHLAEVDRGTVDADTLTLGRFLENGRYGAPFVDLHLIPMGAAVWSADPSTFDDFPATTLFRFLRNHGLLGIGDRPRWRTIVGGSRRYVQAIADGFGGTIRTRTPVLGVRSGADGVVVTSIARAADGDPGTPGQAEAPAVEPVEEAFDRVVLACHSDQALAMLTDASPAEREILGAMRYQPNTATLHTDVSLLSPHRRAWAAWNYDRLGTGDTTAAVTYDMTNLQRLPGSRRYLVSLNSDHRIDPGTVLARFDYAHPVFDQAAVAAQARFAEIDGVRRIHFCGAYWGHGFHEDGMVAALRVCDRIDDDTDHGNTANEDTSMDDGGRVSST